jgi:hypothetical protein
MIHENNEETSFCCGLRLSLCQIRYWITINEIKNPVHSMIRIIVIPINYEVSALLDRI